MSQYDLNSLYDFLTNTPEAGLKKMLVDGKPMTDVHVNLLLKTARACSATEFAEHYEKKDFPKIKMSPNEMKLKEKFWGDCTQTLLSRGLLNPATAPKAA